MAQVLARIVKVISWVVLFFLLLALFEYAKGYNLRNLEAVFARAPSEEQALVKAIKREYHRGNYWNSLLCTRRLSMFSGLDRRQKEALEAMEGKLETMVSPPPSPATSGPEP